MSHPAQNIDEVDTTRRKVFIIVAVITLVLLAGLIFWMTRPVPNAGQQPRLEGALRAGSPEFEQYRQRIVIDFNPDLHATEAPRPLGDIVMQMRPTIRNFTGRTINGLELHAAVVDLENKPIKERTVVWPLPNRQAELEPNKVMEVPIVMEGFRKEDVRANIKIELTGIRFK